MCISVYSPWLPGYITVVQTIFIILTMAEFFLDRSRVTWKDLVLLWPHEIFIYVTLNCDFFCHWFFYFRGSSSLFEKVIHTEICSSIIWMIFLYGYIVIYLTKKSQYFTITKNIIVNIFIHVSLCTCTRICPGNIPRSIITGTWNNCIFKLLDISK